MDLYVEWKWKVERNDRSLIHFVLFFRIDRYFDRIIVNKSDCCRYVGRWLIVLWQRSSFIFRTPPEQADFLSLCIDVCVFQQLIETELSVHSSFGRHSFEYKWNSRDSVDVMGPHQTLFIYFLRIIFTFFILTRLRKHLFFSFSAPELL